MVGRVTFYTSICLIGYPENTAVYPRSLPETFLVAMSEASSYIRWLLLDTSFKYDCYLFNLVKSLYLSGL